MKNNNLKYVIFDGALPVVFGDYFKHSDVYVNGYTATSAGYCNVKHVTVLRHGKPVSSIELECFGESISLKLKPKPSDCKILTKTLSQIT